jgi:predicted nucleic acid-binding protein
MNQVFADTLYWIARVSSDDAWHHAAKSARASRNQSQLVTTHEVLVEFLSAVGGRGALLRSRALQSVRAIMTTTATKVVPQSEASFLAGLDLYAHRSDKEYSLVDCISMQTMRQLGITEVLTNDHHFTQEGFTILIT